MGFWSEVFGSRSDELLEIKKRAEAGDATAQIRLSKIYLYGDVVDRDLSAARGWAAEATYADNPHYAMEAHELYKKIEDIMREEYRFKRKNR